MSFFKDVEGEGAVVVTGGVYKQVELATRDGYLYAKVGGGYVRLMMDGSTSKNGTRLEFLTWDQGLFRDPFGRLCTAERKGAKVLETDRSQKLLGAPE